MVICLERDADLHMAQLMLLPLTVSCFSKIQIGFTFLIPAHPGSPGHRAIKRVCVCVCVRLHTSSEHPNAVLKNALRNRLMTAFQFDLFQLLHRKRHKADESRLYVWFIGLSK